MKIIKTHKIKVYLVKTDDCEYNQYTRYGPNNWFVTMGMSDEFVSNCDEIESLFQEYIKTNNIVEKT